ncbi:MAG: amino acid dehydrogenase [Gemmatimonadetes bacterium]|nr:amino acid dehydrogenase [Gemmatimonadota bacterium]NNF39010.1 amino acid dehydrogenase [Gemmatimonadota bacterium]NNK62526.1 amino acid dehydrogenase [Gemmatimonadota bacterium]
MNPAATWSRYRRYLATPPEVVVEWHDRLTPARGWLVVNSLRGGAAGGGTRMRVGVDREEVVYLAKAMELKFAFSGPAIGGGKSGIDFDSRDSRRLDVLGRWFRAMRPWVSQCYGTGGDLNVDEQRDLGPIFQELGLPHPQIGILAGHFRADPEQAHHALSCLRVGLGLPLAGTAYGVGSLPLTVSDMITGWAVARATRRLLGGELKGVRVTVEGFGNVGGSAALYLARSGARIVAISDAEHILVEEPGLEAPDVEALLARRRRGRLPEHASRRPAERRQLVYRTATDCVVPAAVSGSLTGPRLDALAAAGARWIVCGANQPFRESALGDTLTQEGADARFTVLPDVVGSMGMARAFEHLMRGGPHNTPDDVFEAVGAAVDDAVDEVVAHAGSGGAGLMAATLDLALDRIASSGPEARESAPEC